MKEMLHRSIALRLIDNQCHDAEPRVPYLEERTLTGRLQLTKAWIGTA